MFQKNKSKRVLLITRENIKDILHIYNIACKRNYKGKNKSKKKRNYCLPL